MRIASLKYRLQLPGFELPSRLLTPLREYDDHSAALLDDIADWIEGTKQPRQISRDAFTDLERSLGAGDLSLPIANLLSFTTLLRGIDRLTNSVAEEIVRDLPPRS
jgi:hypothetical protein